MHFKKVLLFFTFSLCVCLDLFAGKQTTSFQREDGSFATAYISTPDDDESFPIVVYLDGSLMQSVENNFSVLSFVFNQKHIGVAAVEKRGITAESIDINEFDAYDSFENRLNDYIHLIGDLNTNLANWNGQIIFLGSSEGGKIAPKLTLQFASQTMGTVLIGSGGGIPFGEEIKYQIMSLAIENQEEFDVDELDQQIEAKYAQMLSQPNSLEKYYEKTYQWFASHLRYNMLQDMLCIDTPIMIIHGALDTQVPVQSSDIVKASFEAAGKENLAYHRYNDLGHSISKRADIFMLILLFSVEHFESVAPAAA